MSWACRCSSSRLLAYVSKKARYGVEIIIADPQSRRSMDIRYLSLFQSISVESIYSEFYPGGYYRYSDLTKLRTITATSGGVSMVHLGLAK